MVLLLVAMDTLNPYSTFLSEDWYWQPLEVLSSSCVKNTFFLWFSSFCSCYSFPFSLLDFSSSIYPSNWFHPGFHPCFISVLFLNYIFLDHFLESYGFNCHLYTVDSPIHSSSPDLTLNLQTQPLEIRNSLL